MKALGSVYYRAEGAAVWPLRRFILIGKLCVSVGCVFYCPWARNIRLLNHQEQKVLLKYQSVSSAFWNQKGTVSGVKPVTEACNLREVETHVKYLYFDFLDAHEWNVKWNPVFTSIQACCGVQWCLDAKDCSQCFRTQSCFPHWSQDSAVFISPK